MILSREKSFVLWVFFDDFIQHVVETDMQGFNIIPVHFAVKVKPEEDTAQRVR